MIGNARNSRSIYISMVSNGCCDTRFDTSYPNQLNGIINPDEFQESLDNVNKSVISIPLLIICVLFPFLCVLGGGALLIVGATMSSDSAANLSVSFLAIGGGILGFGLVAIMGGVCVMQAIQTSRMRKAVAKESEKYCNRLSVPCAWRLNTTTVVVAGYKGKRSSRRIHTLVIMIGATGPSETAQPSNQMSLQPASTFAQRNQVFPSTAQFCSQCGAPRQNQIAKFCSRCGQRLSI
ncbi:unnamed protein product [Adineta ricciae]|uniref:Zinc-ribbon domain-containing protein n=2 Tax=Adineta ricciae TaxID=249248 RepID=A0A814XKI9_ADIRI|nr:unnamed protein product [Adineta ricciae]